MPCMVFTFKKDAITFLSNMIFWLTPDFIHKRLIIDLVYMLVKCKRSLWGLWSL